MPTINTIPTKAGEVCRALITVAVPSGRWYSRHGSETIGAISADSDLAIYADLILSRIWHASGTVFRLNRTGAESLAAWVWGAGNVRANGEFRPGDATNSALGPGHAKSVFIAFGPDGALVEVEIQMLSLTASAGTGWYNLLLTAEQNALLDTIVGDYEVNFVIGDTAGDEPATHDTAGDLVSGAPVVSADAEAVSAGAEDTGATVQSGAPGVTASAEAVPAGDSDIAAVVESGAPVVSASAEKVGVQPPADVGGDVDTGAPVVSAEAEIVGPGATVTVQTAKFLAALWMPRANPARAIMPISLEIEWEAEHLVPALCRELSRLIEWCEFGETCVPSDAGPQGVIPRGSAETVYGGLVVSTDPNQSAPEYEEGDPEPSVSECRLLLTQPVSENHDDLKLFIDRRAELRRVICRLNGEIGS